MNTFYGNGAATSKASPSARNSNNFGLGLLGISQDNLIERNRVGGNVNGVYLGGGGQVIGNVIRRNVIAGNPPAQVVVTFGRGIGADIQDLAPPGANAFEDNYCLTYSGAGPAPCPDVRFKGNDRDSDDDAPGRFVAFGQLKQPIGYRSGVIKQLTEWIGSLGVRVR